MSKISIKGSSEAEKLHISRWPKYCKTPCTNNIVWSISLTNGAQVFLEHNGPTCPGGLGSHADYKTAFSSQLDLHWTGQMELSLEIK